MDKYYIVSKGGEGEITEKKSRFIAHVLPVESEEEALLQIENIKKKYWDARHNCFAFIMGNNNEIQIFSDDGEPQGTAGKPILEVLMGENLRNTLIVVTRYFGGTLLGTGGLVRAYGLSSKEGLKNSVIKEVCPGVNFSVTTDYNSIGKIKYIMSQFDMEETEEYGADVTINIVMGKSDFENFKKKVVDTTSDKAVWSEIKEAPFYMEMP